MTTSEQERTGIIGRPLPRKENYALLTGSGVFVNDIVLDGMLHARILRSPKAHARIVSTDASRARELPGVVDVLTGAEVIGHTNGFGGLQKGLPFNDRSVLAEGKVVFDGQEVAAVAAETWHQAQDAVEAIDVVYEDLPPVVDVEHAVAPGAAKIWEYAEGNVWDTYKCHVGDPSAVEAPVAVAGKFVAKRSAAVAMEPHGCVADYDRRSGKLTLFTSTQFTHLFRVLIADVLRMPQQSIRIIAPNVGGSFGSKGDAFPHEMIACLLSMRTGRPVKLTLDRAEVFRATGAMCGQVTDGEMKVDADGKIVGYHADVLHDTGAVSPWGGQIMRIGLHIGMLPYPIPNIQIDARSVSTNTPGGGPVRGFGIPQVLFVKEQLIDMAAEQAGIDPVEIRLRNIPEVETYETPSGIKIDSTTIRDCLQKAASEIGWSTRHADRDENVGYGVGLAVKYTSARHPSIDTDLSTVRLTIGMDGRVTLRSGDVPHGQGHTTMLSQIVAERLGANYDEIDVVSADTDATPFSLGTFGSRSAAVLGSATAEAADQLRERVLAIAGNLLGAPPEALAVENGLVSIPGVPEAVVPFAALSGTAMFMTNSLPAGVPTGPLEVQATYDTPTEREREDGGGNWAATYSGAAHAARVQVDPDTGEYRILDYVMVHDSGTVINPLIVEGQHHGGFAMGYGMVLGESIKTSGDGQLTNASLATYTIPTAHDVPNLHRSFEINAPSTVIPIGAKGAGETATGPVPAVIANALTDATGVRFLQMPITAEDVALALAEKKRRGVDRLTWPVTDETEEGQR